MVNPILPQEEKEADNKVLVKDDCPRKVIHSGSSLAFTFPKWMMRVNDTARKFFGKVGNELKEPRYYVSLETDENGTPMLTVRKVEEEKRKVA